MRLCDCGCGGTIRSGKRRTLVACQARQDREKAARLIAERRAKAQSWDEDPAAIERKFSRALRKVKGTFTSDPWSRPGSGTEEHSISRALRSTRGRGAA